MLCVCFIQWIVLSLGGGLFSVEIINHNSCNFAHFFGITHTRILTSTAVIPYDEKVFLVETWLSRCLSICLGTRFTFRPPQKTTASGRTRPVLSLSLPYTRPCVVLAHHILAAPRKFTHALALTCLQHGCHLMNCSLDNTPA